MHYSIQIQCSGSVLSCHFLLTVCVTDSGIWPGKPQMLLNSKSYIPKFWHYFLVQIFFELALLYSLSSELMFVAGNFSRNWTSEMCSDCKEYSSSFLHYMLISPFSLLLIWDVDLLLCRLEAQETKITSWLLRKRLCVPTKEKSLIN